MRLFAEASKLLNVTALHPPGNESANVSDAASTPPVSCQEPVFATLERAALECLVQLCTSPSAATQAYNRKDLVSNLLRRLHVLIPIVNDHHAQDPPALVPLLDGECAATICTILKRLAATPDGAHAITNEHGSAVLAEFFPCHAPGSTETPTSQTEQSGSTSPEDAGHDNQDLGLISVHVSAMSALSMLVSSTSVQAGVSPETVKRIASQVLLPVSLFGPRYEIVAMLTNSCERRI